MDDEEYISRADLKRERADVKKLVADLSRLTTKQIDELPVSPGARRAIVDIRRMKKQALKRQLKFATGLLANEDLEAVHRALFLLRQPAVAQTRQLHQIERWRDRLIDGDTGLFGELMQRMDNPDRQRLRQLVSAARKAAEATNPDHGSPTERAATAQRSRTARQLFRFLRDTCGHG